MSYCRECIAVKPEGHFQTAVTLKCRSWGCELCEPDRKRRLIAEGMGGAPCTFLTLTFRIRDTCTPDEAAPMLTRAWRLCRLRLMRKFHWRKLPFFAVMEKTEKGWPHLHIMLRARYIPHKLISDIMKELIDSPVVGIEKITNKSRVAGYVAKYCGKAAAKFKTAKRYFQSQDYDIREESKEYDDTEALGGWLRQSQHILAWSTFQEEEGRKVEWFGYDKAVSYDPRAG